MVLTAHDLLEIFIFVESLEADLDIYDGATEEIILFNLQIKNFMSQGLLR
jgi:hypothetical protein